MTERARRSRRQSSKHMQQRTISFVTVERGFKRTFYTKLHIEQWDFLIQSLFSSRDGFQFRIRLSRGGLLDLSAVRESEIEYTQEQIWRQWNMFYLLLLVYFYSTGLRCDLYRSLTESQQYLLLKLCWVSFHVKGHCYHLVLLLWYKEGGKTVSACTSFCTEVLENIVNLTGLRSSLSSTF